MNPLPFKKKYGEDLYINDILVILAAALLFRTSLDSFLTGFDFSFIFVWIVNRSLWFW